MATPIRVTNPNAPAHRQQAVLVATKEARVYQENKKVFPRPPTVLFLQFTALGHAENPLQAEGISSPSHQQCLGRLVEPFGQYKNAPFHWLVSVYHKKDLFTAQNLTHAMLTMNDTNMSALY